MPGKPGVGGPVPKRSTERRRVNKVPGQTTVALAGHVSVPAADKGWHPIAARWYRSLRKSGQSQYYEPADWAYAQVVAETLSRVLSAPSISAPLFAECMRGMDALLTTESSRRRARLEVERIVAEPDGEKPTSIEDRRKALQG